MLEADRSTRLVRIQAATSAIEGRIKELADSPAGRDELSAMDNALVILHVWGKEVAWCTQKGLKKCSAMFNPADTSSTARQTS
jgi:hypothetical protein